MPKVIELIIVALRFEHRSPGLESITMEKSWKVGKKTISEAQGGNIMLSPYLTAIKGASSELLCRKRLLAPSDFVLNQF